METSAKNGNNVQKAFNSITNQIYKDVISMKIDVSDPNSGVQTGISQNVIQYDNNKDDKENDGPCGNCMIL